MSETNKYSANPKYEPSLGRDAELYEYATSDLSTEELLAGGADVDTLIAAGVLEDDYDPNDPGYSFTEESSEPIERPLPGTGIPKRSPEEFQAFLDEHFKYDRLADEFRKKQSRKNLW